jgi:uncharacterized protein YyaL (SSP411 family)
MALSGRKASFPVVSSLVVILAAISAAAFILRPKIPAPDPTPLEGVVGDYVRAAARQQIPWRTLGPEAFAEARRRGMPILLAVGAPWSRAGRLADATAFADEEITERLRRDYVCIRIDAAENPEWAKALIPVTRAQVGAEGGLQLYFFDSKAQLFSSMLRRFPLGGVESNSMRAALDRADEDLTRFARNPEVGPRPGELQAADRALLIAPAASDAAIDASRHFEWIARNTHPRYGGAPMNGFQFLRPTMWRLLTASGQIDLLRRSLDPALRTGIVDWLDGGFFRLAEDDDWRRIEFDKIASQNAEMAAALALAYRLAGDPLYRYLAERTADTLTDSFANLGSVRAYRLSDEAPDGRSARSSFSPRLLRELFEPNEREWLRDNLGLRVEDNPQMVPELVRREAFDTERERLDRFLLRMHRGKRRSPATYGAEGLLDVNGTVVARLYEAARLLADEPRRAKAARLFGGLRRWRAGKDDVVHSIQTGGASSPYLKDYLAYADAALQRFLAEGDDQAFRDGFQVLSRGAFLFSSGQGRFDNGRFGSLAPGLEALDMPDVFDDPGESSSATMLRLLYSYGTLAQGGDLGPRGALMLTEAQALARQSAAVVNRVANFTSGLVAADLLRRRGLAVVAVGRDAVSVASEMARLAIADLVAPATGPVRPDLGRRPPGLYVLDGDQALGPFDRQGAIERLTAIMRERRG